MKGYRRARLCLLCECPVVDGGVRLRKTHLEKLSRWWKAHFDTDFEHKSRIVCQFCVWDLRYVEEHSEEKEPAEQKWWCKFNAKYYKYYKDELIKSCFVKLDNLANAEKLLQESDVTMTPCLICKKIISIKQIYAHVRSQHKGEKIVKCPYEACGTYFKSEEEKLKHIKETHDPIRCLYCDKFILKSMYQHVYKWHKDVAIKCNFQERCPNYFKTLEDREKHVREVHQAEKIRKPVQCPYCDLLLVGKNTLAPHIKLKHSKIAIKCQYPQCGAYCKSHVDLEKHFSLKPKHKPSYEKKEQQVYKKYKCSLCQKGFYSRSALKEHIIQEQHNPIQEVCPHCKKTPSNNKVHVVSDFCKKCNQKFRCLGLLKSHALKCKRVFQCPVCKKEFEMECLLSYHCKRYHTVPILKWKGLQFKSRGFKCDECFTYFRTRFSLERHRMVLHETYTICRCDFCKKQFPNKLSLKWHISRNHLAPKQKSLICPVCNLRLNSEDMLKVHIQSKCSREYVQCQVCEILLKRTSLKNHLKEMH